MIQRVQSVFLLLAALCGIPAFFFPIATYYSDHIVFNYFLCSLRDFSTGPIDYNPLYTLSLSVLQVIVFLISLFTIFKFKNRILQTRLVTLNIFLTVVLVGGIFYYDNLLKNTFEALPEYNILFFIFPLVSIILLFLANIYIKKDERLVRSADRLR
jgi:hypothetical protein